MFLRFLVEKTIANTKQPITLLNLKGGKRPQPNIQL